MPKPLKLGMRSGQADLRWTVFFLDVAGKEALEFLSRTQYEHVVDAIRSLARERDPRRPTTEEVSPIGDFYELKLKGGPLGRTNVRVFFDVIDERNVIVIVHAYKKEQEHQTPRFVKDRVSRRLRGFRNGEYGDID